MEGFVSPDDRILTTVASEVKESDIGSVGMQSIIAKMHKIVYGNQIDIEKPIMVGVAAPQIGVARRIILVDVAAEGHGHVGNLNTYVNPNIEWVSTDVSEWYEGCYSTDRVCGIVSRPNRIRISALDETGRRIEEEHSGYVARIFQHEIDHLNGIVFIDHINNDANLHWVALDRMAEYRNNEGWRSWEVGCSRSKWLNIKGVTP